MVPEIRDADFARAEERARLVEQRRREEQASYVPHPEPLHPMGWYAQSAAQASDIPMSPNEGWTNEPGRIIEAPTPPVGGKAGEILQHLHPGEPVFIFRAQDVLSVFALEAYSELIDKYNGRSPQALSLSDAIHAFRQWQVQNPHWVKLPD